MGKPRALCCRDNLVELNPGVTGDWFPKENVRLHLSMPTIMPTLSETNIVTKNALDFEKLFSSSRPFTMILYTLPLNSKHVAFLESYSNQHNIPILTASTSGFYAYFSLRLHSWFPVVDTHPDEAAIADLRLLNPWPELSTFASRMVDNIQHLNDHDHGHLPLVVILLHYLEKWKLTHGGNVPKAYSEKTAFRALVAQGARTNNSEGGEENFDEAISAVMKYITQSSLPESLREIFEHEENLKVRVF